MYTEICEIPDRARQFMALSKSFTLPVGFPYVGMGSSYFASIAFKFMGVDIQPELASELYCYGLKKKLIPNGVILSQSGKSTEVLWCTKLFKEFSAITNDVSSPLAIQPNAAQIIPLFAGEEEFSSSKTYINTLLAMFKGFHIDTISNLNLLSQKMVKYEGLGKAISEAVFERLSQKNVSSIYITGNGPNIATALQAALVLSESTKIGFYGMPMAQYDHGPKETAKNSIVFVVNAQGPAYERTKGLINTISKAGAAVFEVEEPESTEELSVLHNIIPFNFMAYYLTAMMGVKEIFVVGSKITEVGNKK